MRESCVFKYRQMHAVESRCNCPIRPTEINIVHPELYPLMRQRWEEERRARASKAAEKTEKIHRLEIVTAQSKSERNAVINL